MNRTDRTRTDREWEAATWEGARREELRRWAELPLERIVAAQEEMAELAEMLATGRLPDPAKERSKADDRVDPASPLPYR